MRPSLSRSRTTSALVAGLVALQLAAGVGSEASRLAPCGQPPPAGSVYNSYNNCTALSEARATVVVLAHPAHITGIADYHYNEGLPVSPGTIGLRAPNGHLFGPYAAVQQPGAFDWVATVNLTVPAGTYTVVDSNPFTWSQNSASGGRGFTRVFGSFVTSAPPLPPPVSATPAAPKPPLPFKACFVNAGSVASLGPCGGPVGTVITIRTSRPLAAPIGKVWFYETSAHASLGGTVCYACATVTVSLTGGGNLAKGGTAADSYYEFRAPSALCLNGSGQGWAAFPIPTGGTSSHAPHGYGDIGTFTVEACR